MAKSGRFSWLNAILLTTSCSSAIDSHDVIVVTFPDAADQTSLIDSRPISNVPCKTEAQITTSSGMIVVIYLDCVETKKSGPMSDEPGWNNENEGEQVAVPPGWTRPPPPGDPTPY